MRVKLLDIPDDVVTKLEAQAQDENMSLEEVCIKVLCASVKQGIVKKGKK